MKTNIIKIAIMLIVGFIMNGCAAMYSHNADPNAKPRDVTIVEKEPYTTMQSAGINGLNNTLYTVKDKQGRKYTVHSNFDNYDVNACMTLWHTKNIYKYDQYPRLTPTGVNCKVIKPESDVGERFTYDDSKDLYSLSLDYWLGESVNSLVETWGAPDKQYTAGGVSYIAYSLDRSNVNTNYDWLGNAHVSSSNSNCQTTFTINNGVVSSYQWKGNSCPSLLPR